MLWKVVSTLYVRTTYLNCLAFTSHLTLSLPDEGHYRKAPYSYGCITIPRSITLRWTISSIV